MYRLIQDKKNATEMEESGFCKAFREKEKEIFCYRIEIILFTAYSYIFRKM